MLASLLDEDRVHFADMKTVGHTKARCKEPIKEADDGGFGAGSDTGGFGAPAAGGGDGWAAESGGAIDDWGTQPAAMIAGGGDQVGW